MDDNNIKNDKNEEITNISNEIIKDVNITKEMKTSFLNYAMSVIVSRAIPDVRDGLKPVHRRILYAMNDLGMHADKQFKKSARIVGEVIGKYHPHGEAAVYDSMVRMAQDFSYRYPLINGHGNFGSIDGDGAAAQRYTEAKMSKISMEMLKDLNKDTVDFKENYDGSETEPAVLPAKYPNLLVNGATGIAVGMATNIPPHNLGEVIDGVLALIDNPEIDVDELADYIKGPDFPTGGILMGLSNLRRAYRTGNGSVVVRAKTDIVTRPNGKSSIIVNEIPYQVNKTRLIEKIAELAKEKRIDGITDLRDESNRKGMRIVIDVRKDVNADVLLNNLFKYTQLQASYGINLLSLVNNEPKVLNIKQILEYYLLHQIEVLLRKTKYELDKAKARLHILEGLIIALDNIDEIIEVIKNAEYDEMAKMQLITIFNLSDEQARAILDMRLKRLTGLEKDKIRSEAEQLRISIANFENIITSKDEQYKIIAEELTEIKNRYGDNRRTEISLSDNLDIEDEDLIPVEEVVITITNKGYVKRMTVDTYRSQHRGGVGLKGIKTFEDDFVENIISTSTHSTVLFFTNYGKAYRLKGYQIPESGRNAKGIPIVNLLNLEEDEYLATALGIEEFNEGEYLFFITKAGIVKRTDIIAYSNIRSNGLRSINLDDDDELLAVRKTNGNNEIIIGASNGKAIRFKETDVRSMGRITRGVKGISLSKGESAIGITIVDENRPEILVVTENGYGKRTVSDEYRTQIRGGKGVKTLNVTEKNGVLVKLRSVSEDQDLLIITDKGMVIRIPTSQISQSGRTTQGVRLIRLQEGHKVSNIALVPRQEDNEKVDEELLEEEIINNEETPNDVIEEEQTEKTEDNQD